MIVLFTDFGWQGPYVGQMKAVLLQHAPQQAVIDLMHDAPAFNPKASAYLLNALCQQFPPGCVFLAVVDPGVGSPERRAVIVQADGQWFVGPDNGLFEIISRTAKEVKYWEITWRPKKISASFHGRDLFAPVAAALAAGKSPKAIACSIPALTLNDWPLQFQEIIYIDHYGNATTGLMAMALTPMQKIGVAGNSITHARTFSEVPVGHACWYVNSIGLIELAVNQGNFSAQYGGMIGEPITLI